MTEPLEQVLAERIRDSGPMPFAAFMSTALYHPKLGYYTAGPRRVGWRGHFLTSPELDPAFGHLWSRGFEDMWRACGAPESFEIVEIGPGEGTFAAAVLDAVSDDFGATVHYTLVERSPAMRERQEARLANDDRVGWAASVTEVPTAAHGCVFANEVLDNLPVHLVAQRNGSLREVCVDLVDDRFEFVELPPSSPELERFVDRCDVELPEGHRFEVALASDSFVTRCAAMIERGCLVFIDYGTDAADLAARPAGTLLAYSDAGADDLVLERPGGKDITAHANWTAVTAVARREGFEVAPIVSQRRALEALGLHDLHEALRGEHQRAIAEGRGVDAVSAISRRQSLGALADPGGLGSLGVLTATKNISWSLETSAK